MVVTQAQVLTILVQIFKDANFAIFTDNVWSTKEKG